MVLILTVFWYFITLSWVFMVTCNLVGQNLWNNESILVLQVSFLSKGHSDALSYKSTERKPTTCQERAMRGGGGWVWMELFLRQRSGGVFSPLFFPNGVGWGADMARISALVGVGVGLTFWDILRFINAPVDIKPRSSDWRGGFCLCVPGVGSSQIHPHPLSHSPRAQSCRSAGSSATLTPEDLHV